LYVYLHKIESFPAIENGAEQYTVLPVLSVVTEENLVPEHIVCVAILVESKKEQSNAFDNSFYFK
jgi:hypothetical protein